MKFFRKLRVLVLLFALLALVIGFTVISTPKPVQAKPACCAWCMICSELPPYNCWCVCCGWCR